MSRHFGPVEEEPYWDLSYPDKVCFGIDKMFVRVLISPDDPGNSNRGRNDRWRQRTPPRICPTSPPC